MCFEVDAQITILKFCCYLGWFVELWTTNNGVYEFIGWRWTLALNVFDKMSSRDLSSPCVYSMLAYDGSGFFF